MVYKLYTKLAHASNYGGSRNASAIKYIVMHYTANKTDTAYANANYFQSANRKASAHYFVDKTSIYQSVQDLKVAWSVGGSKYSDCAKTGGGKLYKICTNTNSISIELCSDNGVIENETVENAIKLVKSLMVKYNVPIDRVIRHFDVNGKKCIGWTGWLPTTNETLWNNFKERLNGSVVSTPSQPSTTTPSTNLTSIGKVHAKNFIGQSNTSKNIDSLTLKQLKSMVLQRAINLDYNKGLTLDADFGNKSKSALGTHYIKQGEKQYMVTCAEILMYLNNKNPNGVELPATFDDRLVKASGKTKITASDFLSYIV